MMNQLIYKQILKNLFKKKESLLIVWLVTVISAFIYFFVQVSIDGNIIYAQGLADKELLVALQSNTILARVFLISFLFILLFLYYMFYNRFLRDESMQIGCYKMLGFQNGFLRRTYMMIYVIVMSTGIAAGMILGYLGSFVLLTNYEVSYSLDNLVRGLTIFNLIIGVFLPILIIGVFLYLMIGKFTRKEVNVLLKQKENKSSGVLKFSNAISNLFPGELAYSIRIAFRNPIAILLTLGSVFIFNILFLFSVSLNLSSSAVMDSQLNGRSFLYRAEMSEIYYLKDYEEGEKSQNADFQLKKSGTLVKDKQVIMQNIVGLEQDSQFFELQTANQVQIPELGEQEVIVGARIHEVYDINEGDKVFLEIDGKRMTAVVINIAQNADNNTVYVKKENLEKHLALREGSFNVILSEQKFDLNSGTVLSMQQVKKNVENNNVSNRLSAVICQVLAIIVGTLLLFAAILLNFEENFSNIIKLTILGYTSKEINNMLISIHTTIIMIGFCILIYPSILIGKGISTSLSRQTGDYMPFYTNVVIIGIGFLMVEVIYFGIKWIFSKKVGKFISAHELVDSI